jgi:hypothetical protein
MSARVARARCAGQTVTGDDAINGTLGKKAMNKKQ